MNARLSFNTACELGFRGSLDDWERLRDGDRCRSHRAVIRVYDDAGNVIGLTYKRVYEAELSLTVRASSRSRSFCRYDWSRADGSWV